MYSKNNIKKIFVTVFVLIAGIAFSDFKESMAGDETDYNGYGISGNPDYQKLMKKPVKISKTYNRDNEERFSIVSDYHMLISTSIDKVADLLADLDSSEEVFPRMASSEVYYRADYPEEIFYQRVKTDFETLGIGKEFEYTLKVHFDEKTEKCFKMRWALNESIDNSFSVFDGSWYCEEVLINDKKYTYLRNFTETEFIDPGFITVFAVKHFSEGEIRKAFKSIAAAVQ